MLTQMNKFIKLGKRILALFIVVLLNVNTYAAVGANDGSAFVTKAEFDALVNTFNDQMDIYQSGLNSKIDGAIANYLAGLSSTKRSPQTALINNLGKFAFVNTWDIWPDGEQSELGDKFKWTYGITISFTMQSSIGSWEVYSGDSDSSASQVTVGTKQSKFIYSSKSNTNEGYYCISGLLYSNPVSSYSVSYLRSVNLTSNTVGGPTPAMIQRENITTFGSETKNIGGTIFGANISLQGTANFNTEDKVKADIPMLKKVSGKTVGTGATVYHVLNTEQTKLKTTNLNKYKANCKSTSSWPRRRNSSGQDVVNGNFANATNYGMYSYEHDYKEVAAAQGYTYFIDDTISSVSGKPTGYYEGLPLFKAGEDGTVEMLINFTNSNNDNTKFEVKEGAFGNTEISPGFGDLKDASCQYVDDEGNVIKNIYTIPSGKTVTMKFECKKNNMYWIKAEPTNGETTISASSIDIITE